MSNSLSELAAQFRALHTRSQLFVLPNAWDCGGARLYEEAGFAAIGTTSAGIANALGYPDGQKAPREEVLFIIKRIAASVRVPVTADIEAAYGSGSVDDVLMTVRGVLDAGAVGINLEDSSGSRDALADKVLQLETIRAIRALCDELGVPLVINARVDAFLLPALSPEAKFKLAVERANLYRAAGADCLFVPFVSDAAIIGELVKAIDGPLNILATAGTPPVSQLEQLGVRRVSIGSGPYRATMALVREIARELRDSGTFAAFTERTIPPAEMNGLFAP